jgi:hypothetical protein
MIVLGLTLKRRTNQINMFLVLQCNHLRSILKIIFRLHNELGHHRLWLSESLRSTRKINVVSFDST